MSFLREENRAGLFRARVLGNWSFTQEENSVPLVHRCLRKTSAEIGPRYQTCQTFGAFARNRQSIINNYYRILPMNLKKVRQLVVVIVVSGLLVYGGFRLGEWRAGSGVKNLSEIDTTSMNDVLARLKASYLKPADIDPKKLMYGATKGMTQALGEEGT